MAIERKPRPKWVEELLAEADKPVPPGELKRRRQAFEWVMAHRTDIRPDRVQDYIRAIREDEDDD